MVTACSVGLAIPVPGEAVTCTGCSVSVYTTCNRQVQCYRILAALCIGEDIVMVTACSVGLAIPVPGEAVTCTGCSVSVYATCNGQVQRHRILAALCIGEDIVMVTACSVGLAIPVPGEAVTCTGCSVCVYATCNGQVQGHRILAALCIGEDIVMVTACTVGLSIPVPGEAVTCTGCSVSVYTTCNGQVQGQRICAAIGIRSI